MVTEIAEKKKGRGQGFASHSPEERRRIASLGGLAAHRSGKAHEWNSAEAREAGMISRKRGPNRKREPV